MSTEYDISVKSSDTYTHTETHRDTHTEMHRDTHYLSESLTDVEEGWRRHWMTEIRCRKEQSDDLQIDELYTHTHTHQLLRTLHY